MLGQTTPKISWSAPLLALTISAQLFAPQAALAQDQEEKAEMLVRNYRNETITMDFSYVFRDYSWALMEREIGVDGDLIYRFPTNLPGCEYLIDWGIDTARLTISNARQVICSRDVSICEKRTITVDVRQQVCRTRVK